MARRKKTAQQKPEPKPAFRISASPHLPEPQPSKRAWWRNYKIMIPLWAVMIALTWWGLEKNVDRSVIAGSVVAVGLVSNAFAWLLGIIAMVPIIGPLIVKVLSIGFIWLLNGVGYLVSFIAIKRGYSKDVLTYRGLTVAVIIGIVIGFVIGKLV